MDICLNMASNVVNKYISSRIPVNPTVQLGDRNVEVTAVGAWVQPTSHFVDVTSGDATVAAKAEEERNRRIQAEKEAKLKQFQDEVRSRVQMLQKLKVQQQIKKTYKAVETERNIIQQSTSAAERTFACKSTGGVKTDHQEHTLKPSLKSDKSGAHDEEEHQTQAYTSQSKQVHQYTQSARKNLGAHKVVRKQITEQTRHDYAKQVHNGSGDWRDRDDLSSSEKSEDEDELKENSPLNKPESQTGKLVRFDEIEHEEQPRTSRPKSSLKKSKKPASAGVVVPPPEIYPGVESEEQQRLAVTQRAIYRRLFMDHERQQVRETQRRRQHQQRISELKKEKEEERNRIELASMKMLEPVDSFAVEQSLQTESSKWEEEQESLQLSRQQQRAQRNKDSQRFVEALRSRLREKMAQRNLELPALCCCGTSLWDTSPDTCANNCVFYKNPKAYAKALECVLASCDVV